MRLASLNPIAAVRGFLAGIVRAELGRHEARIVAALTDDGRLTREDLARLRSRFGFIGDPVVEPPAALRVDPCVPRRSLSGDPCRPREVKLGPVLGAPVGAMGRDTRLPPGRPHP